jgi:PAS domain S-box-containing protein
VTGNAVFDGSGEMWSVTRAYDWESSPLGPADDWPQSLKTAVHILLSSRFSMWMAWGPELVFFYNDAYRKATLGKKHPWALGRPAREVWSEIWDEIGPRIQSVLDTGVATWDEGLLLFLERSGFSEETYHTFSYSPLKDDNGKVAGMLCVVTEETNRVLGERQLASLKRLASELGTAITAEEVCRIAIDNCRANQQDLPFTLTYLVDESKQQAQLFCATGFDDDDPAAPSTIDLKSLSGTWPISSVLKANDSLVIDVKEVSDRLPRGALELPANKALLVPIAQRGQKRGAGVLIAGLSPYRMLNSDYEGYIKLIAGQLAASLANADAYEQERKRTLALAEIDRAKTMFFSNVSHELRTPLTLMLGPLEDELARTNSGTESKHSLELVHRNGLRLLKLVNTLLEFSRAESGRLNSRFEPVDLAKVTAEYASAFHSAVERAGLRFVVDCPPLSEAVYIDREMWEKIILNFLSNSLKSTFEGEIAVTVRAVEGGAQVAIRDTGTGIPEDEVPHLFERFRRVEGAHRRTHEGSGIGLALVHELVGLHGGVVEVETVIGKGTTFTVTLPFGHAHLPPERVSTTKAARTGSSASAYVNEALTWLPQLSDNGHVPAASLEGANGRLSDPEMPRVLLADDNRDMRDYVAQLLNKKFRVEVAENGKIALELALSSAPQLILTDVMMPEMDGFQLLAAVRQSDSLKDVPVIMLSARAGEESRLDGLGAGADDYLVKPFTARELIARVTAHVAMASLRQEAAKRERELLLATQVERDRLRESETRLKLATEAAKLGVFAWDTVEDRGNWENDRMYEIFGRTREEGLVNGAVFMNEVVHPDYRDVFQKAVKATLEQGNVFEFEGMIYRRDQSLRWIEINGHLQSQGSAPAGRILGTIRDITHAKMSEEALRNSVKQLGELAAIVASSDDVILSKNLNGIITSWNAAATRVFGYTAEEMMGSSIFKLIPEELHSEESAIIAQVRAGHIVEHFETKRLTKSGQRLDVSLTISPIKDEQGRVIGASKILRDISGRKRMEQALLQAEKIAATSRMAATIAHEVNNPLEAVMNLLYLLRTKITDSEGIEYLNSAEAELGRVSHIAKQTLGYYREHTSASRASLADIVLQAISIYEPRCTVVGITIRKSLNSSKMVALRRGEMMQVISNLISNSIYAMPTGGTLSISVEDAADPEDGTLLVIQDDGVGIAADDLPRVFDAFFSTRSAVGTGIGLFVTKQFVEGHGGHIEIKSRKDAEHHGTAVYVFLPLHTAYDDLLTSSSVH